MSHKPIVSIIQRRLTHYRVPLFDAMRDSLDRSGITLRLLHGHGTPAEQTKNDAGTIDWAEPLATRYLARNRLCWQPFARQVAGSDLAIITQENALVANHFALLRKPAPRLAFWGHGANFQGAARSWREGYKRWTARQVDWYFAYTQKSVDLVAQTGVPRDKITCLNNAVDIAGLRADLADIGPDEANAFRAKLGLTDHPVGLFLGSLYADKRIDFIIEAAERIRAQVDGFQLVIVGDGPLRAEVDAAANRLSWVHATGALRGRDKARALKVATLNMNPGLVGLGILDSFAAAVPLVTTDCGFHSPEIAYLTPDNGVITADDIAQYAAACTELLLTPAAYARLVAGCHTAAETYTLPNMVDAFCTGIQRALEPQE